jgi:predicted Ser/Thr protein kinase
MSGVLYHFFLVACFVSIVKTDPKIEKVTQRQANFTHTITTLSEARSLLAATSSGDLVIFGGGINGTETSDRVDIFNVTSGSWKTATLSIPCSVTTATSSGNLIFFGGDRNKRLGYCNRVDIYNISNATWRTATLSQPRLNFVVTSVRNLVLFAGGFVYPTGPSNVIDIYNVTNDTWTNATLSVGRYFFPATSVDNRYVLLAGGWVYGSKVTNVVDIFDSLHGKWLTATLSKARGDLSATSLGNLAFLGGGNNGSSPFNVVDIFNSSTLTWSTATLSQARYYIAAASVGDIVAFGGGWTGSAHSAVVDMYNVTSNSWFIAHLNQSRFYLAATSAINKIFFGGGYNNWYFFDMVDIFCFGENCQLPPPLPPSLSGSTSPTSQILTEGPIPQSISSLTPLVADQSPFHQMSDLSFKVIFAFVVGIVSLLLTMGLTLFVILFTKQRKEKTNEENSTNDDQKQALLDDVYQALNTQIRTYFPIAQTEQSALNTEIANKYAIPFEEIAIQKELGNGSYGRVCLGLWNGAPVALKFCKEREKLDDFWKEFNLVMKLPPHPNVVQAFGISRDGPQPVLIMEYCAGGSLDRLLYECDDKTLNETEKIELVKGIARGMLHLHNHNIIHRDLAARNILLSSTGTAKITDFGMSRVLQRDEEGKTNTNVGPIRWMAPESLANLTYSKKSDVWSFGILVYEIVAQCEPHADVDRLDVGPLIRDQCLTPTIPRDCPLLLRKLMQMCWNKEPHQRPSFKEICRILES